MHVEGLVESQYANYVVMVKSMAPEQCDGSVGAAGKGCTDDCQSTCGDGTCPFGSYCTSSPDCQSGVTCVNNVCAGMYMTAHHITQHSLLIISSPTFVFLSLSLCCFHVCVLFLISHILIVD